MNNQNEQSSNPEITPFDEPNEQLESTLVIATEDPRLKNNAQKKIQKSKGQGRNTESFDPKSTLVRPDLRIIIGKPSSPKWGRVLKHDDVVMVPNFICDEDDWTIYNTLIHEMREIQQKNVKGSEWISWHEGAHLISKNPAESKTFQMIQKKIADYFGINNNSVGTRFNWYRDSADWKPFHHDSAAFNPERARNQNITVGVSFGVTRELAFLHAKNNTKIYFPQTNGMMFSFGRDVNIQWKHGVNYVPEEQQKEEEALFKSKVDIDVSIGRISIILWGNCPHVVEEANSPPMLTDNTRGNGHNMHRTREQDRDRDNRYGRYPTQEFRGRSRSPGSRRSYEDERRGSRSRSRDHRDHHYHRDSRDYPAHRFDHHHNHHRDRHHRDQHYSHSDR